MCVFDRIGAAKFLGISVKTLDRYRANGKLGYRKIGDRVVLAKSDLLTFFEDCAVPPAAISSNREKRAMTKTETAIGGEM